MNNLEMIITLECTYGLMDPYQFQRGAEWFEERIKDKVLILDDQTYFLYPEQLFRDHPQVMILLTNPELSFVPESPWKVYFDKDEFLKAIPKDNGMVLGSSSLIQSLIDSVKVIHATYVREVLRPKMFLNGDLIHYIENEDIFSRRHLESFGDDKIAYHWNAKEIDRYRFFRINEQNFPE